MTCDAIKSVREAKWLTQEFVAEILWISRQTYSKIEKGESELSLWWAVKLSELLWIKLEDLSYSSQKNDFDRWKYKQIIKNCIKFGSEDGSITKTKLAKLCYLVDFSRYYYHLTSITNAKYLRMLRWPVPKEYFIALEELQEEESIAINQNWDAFLLHNIESPKTDKLSEDELALIQKIWEKWRSATTQEVVDFTHHQLPRIMCEHMEEIPYSFITQEDPSNVF